MKLYEIFKRLSERLTDEEQREVDKWEKALPEMVAATDHFFGVGVDEKYIEIHNTTSKSDTHLSIEKHLGREISQDEYKSGQINVGMGKPPMRIGKMLNKSKAPEALARGYENDTTRQGKSLSNLKVLTTRSAIGVAGQTSHGQSWEQESCKNFNTGRYRSCLPKEVKAGTIVHYLIDDKGTEISRATSHPHINNKGNVMYVTDSIAGVRNQAFLNYLAKTNKELSGTHKGGSVVYKKAKGVYNDNKRLYALHVSTSPEELEKALTNRSPKIREAAIMHSEVTLAQLERAVSDPDVYVAVAAVKNKKSTESVLIKALEHPNHHVKIAAIKNKNVTTAVYNKALDCDDSTVRWVVMDHPINSKLITPELVNKASHDSAGNVRGASARYLDFSDPEQFKRFNELFLDPAPRARAAIAKDHRISSEQLEQMFNDEDDTVRSAVITNQKTPAYLMPKALADSSNSVRMSALENIHATKSQREAALKDPDRYVRSTAERMLKKYHS